MKVAFITCGLCLVLLTGCGDSHNVPEVRKVRGEVRLDGRPLESGEIVFEPIDLSASSAGRVTQGRFSFPSRLGSMHVRITALQAVKRDSATNSDEPEDILDPNSPYTTIYVSLIPEKYNSKTTLNAHVTRDGGNNFTFELTSQK
ncbi:MAG TPA: hypothetical protein VNQ76_05590 [Planctomicrobium sp.]|nr:hypothetical protein [Planctomicrobium sp.]